jgi:nucleoside-diphosphate kinase
MVSEVLKGGFQITDMEIFHLEKANAEEFLEVYKDVVIEYHVRFLKWSLLSFISHS